MKLSTVSRITSELRQKVYSLFYWNCKLPQVEVGNNMSNFEIYFPLLSEITDTFLKNFYSMLLCGISSDYYKKRKLSFLVKVFRLPKCF